MIKLLKIQSEQKQEMKEKVDLTEKGIHVKSKIRVTKKGEEEKERKGAQDETTAWKDD